MSSFGLLPTRTSFLKQVHAVICAVLVFAPQMPSVARAQCCGEAASAPVATQTYRLDYQTVYDEQQVTAYRVSYETVYDTKTYTVTKPVWETQTSERRYTVQDPTYTGDAIETYASRVRAAAEAERRVRPGPIPQPPDGPDPIPDVGEARIVRAVEALRADRQFMDSVRRGGEKWGTAQRIIANTLPDTLANGQD